MKIKKVGNKILLRLDKDDEIVSAIKSVCAENDVKFGFVTGIGGVKHAVFAFYDMAQHKYVNTEVSGHHELTSLLGNVSRKDGEFVMHLHITLGGADYGVVGGHLVSAVISVTGEIWIEVLEDGFSRKFNEEFGANLWED